MGKRNGRAFTGPTFGADKFGKSYRRVVNNKNKALAVFNTLKRLFKKLSASELTSLTDKVMAASGTRRLSLHPADLRRLADSVRGQPLRGEDMHTATLPGSAPREILPPRHIQLMRKVFSKLNDAELRSLFQQLRRNGIAALPDSPLELEVIAFERCTPWLVARGLYLSSAAAHYLTRSPERLDRFPHRAVGGQSALVIFVQDGVIRKFSNPPRYLRQRTRD